MEGLIKSYSDRNYNYPTIVNHKGVLLSFSMDDEANIYYTVLDLNQDDDEKSKLDAEYWTEEPKQLPFPREITQVGFGIVSNTLMPIFKKGSKTEEIFEADASAEEGRTKANKARPMQEDITPGDIDTFLSSTARLTANAPFQVVSDNQYLYVFRQSISGDDANALIKLKSGGCSGNASHPDRLLDSNEKTIPIVSNALLCDRFVLSGNELKAKQEVRYRRSGHKTRPLSQSDTLGAIDMSGNAFIEPTLELEFISGLTEGRFCVLRIPTQITEIYRWQIFAYNQETKKIDSFNMAQSKDGLFDSKGSLASSTIAPMTKNSFRFENVSIMSGISATLYQQQEQNSDTQSTSGVSRVILSTSGRNNYEKSNHIVTLDFGISHNGLLAQVTEEIALTEIENNQERITKRLHNLENEAQNIKNKIDKHLHDNKPLAMLLSTNFYWEIYILTPEDIYFSEEREDIYFSEEGEERGKKDGYFEEYNEHFLDKIITKGYTLEFWVNPTPPIEETRSGSHSQVTHIKRDWHPIIGTQHKDLQVLFSPEGKLKHNMMFQTYDDNKEQSIELTSNPNTLTLGAWQHVAVTCDLKTVKMLVNGTLVEETTIPDGAYFCTPSQFYIGSNEINVNTFNGFQGGLDEIRFWHRPRTINEINQFKSRRLSLENSEESLSWIMVDGKLNTRYEDRMKIDLINGDMKSPRHQIKAPEQLKSFPPQQYLNELEDTRNKILAIKKWTQDGPLEQSANLAMDKQGLTFYGQMLGESHDYQTPAITQSATGDIALYFQGQDNHFLSTYHNTRVIRTMQLLTLKDGTKLLCRAKVASKKMNDYIITVSKGDSEDTCNVTFNSLSTSFPTETWRAVPRDAQAFAEVINGRSTTYDYDEQVTSTKQDCTFDTGSLCFNVIAPQSHSKVINGKGHVDVEGSGSVWQMESLEKALLFDGVNDHLSLEKKQLSQLSLSREMALEAWIKPESQNDDSFIITQKNNDQSFGLGIKAGVAGSNNEKTEHSIFAEFNNKAVKSIESFAPNQWHHICAVFKQSYALNFSGKQSYLSVKHADVLNNKGSSTLEAAFVLLDTEEPKTHIIVSKGSFSDAPPSPIHLMVDAKGKLIFSFQDENNKTYEVGTSDHTISTGQLHRVSVVRSEHFANPIEGLLNGRDSIKVTELENLDISLPGSTEIETNLTVTLYIDNKKAGEETFNNIKLGENEEDLIIGAYLSEPLKGLKGSISELRLWNKSLNKDNLWQPVTTKTKGLIAHWEIEENEGTKTCDSAGSHHAKIHGAKWMRNPDPLSSTLELYSNGTKLETEVIPAHLPLQNELPDQFALAAKLTKAGPKHAFKGQVDEVRVWKACRTQEQITDNLFTRLKGEKQYLLANYCFNDENMAEGIYDLGLHGNHLHQLEEEYQPSSVLSGAPISNDTAQVKPAFSGVETPFHALIESAPAVGEYADLQYDSQNNLNGVMKRCYSYIQDGKWILITGYKVGNLITEWVGQAQFDPQIMGYLEGAPPVPSENMTYGTNGTGTGIYEGDGSRIELVQASEVNYNYSASKEKGFEASFENEIQAGFEGKINNLLAPMGFGISFPIEMSVSTNNKMKFETSGKWLDERHARTGSVQTRNLSATLGGNWEDPDNMYNPEIGRRWLSANKGFAVVQSETADIFALRLEHNNALIAYRFLPNPDIPKDWNIISFPIDPKYIKQGTLDGKLGYNAEGQLVTDPDYPNAAEYGEHSYFKPTQAYALKRKIEREEQELESYYRQFEASPIPKSAFNNLMSLNTPSLSSVFPISTIAKSLTTLLQSYNQASHASTMKEDMGIANRHAKRNIANTYIWTADGGVFKQSTQTIDVIQEVTGGSYQFSSKNGQKLSIEGNGAGAKFGVELDASLSGAMHLTQHKSKESTTSFSIELDVASSGNMQRHDPKTGKPQYKAGKPDEVAGRVDAYRWMTFYQHASRDNFDALFNTVVDADWLQNSDDANAIAMRQAKQNDKSPPCWRVNHIVTFISRILPEVIDDSAAPLAKAMKQGNVSSNWQLIQKLEPSIKTKTSDIDTFRHAVKEALKSLMPEMLPHFEEISAYLSDYYDVPKIVA